jgi:hypothetical protein
MLLPDEEIGAARPPLQTGPSPFGAGTRNTPCRATQPTAAGEGGNDRPAAKHAYVWPNQLCGIVDMGSSLVIVFQKGEGPMVRRWWPVVFIGSVLFGFMSGGAARAQSLPAVLLQGQAIGSGEIGIGGGRVADFHFRLDPETVGKVTPGQILFYDRANNTVFISQQITAAFMDADQLLVQGFCTVNGFLSTFQMQASAARVPGQQASFFLCFDGPFDSACYGDFVSSGSITLLLRRPTPTQPRP